MLCLVEFPKAEIEISGVEKDGDGYKATAKLSVRGASKDLAATFVVLETMADGVRIKGKAVMNRHDFGVGRKEGDSAAAAVNIELQLTLKTSG